MNKVNIQAAKDFILVRAAVRIIGLLYYITHIITLSYSAIYHVVEMKSSPLKLWIKGDEIGWIVVECTSVPLASSKVDEWVIDWVPVRDFSQSASSAMEVAKETKFGIKVA